MGKLLITFMVWVGIEQSLAAELLIHSEQEKIDLNPYLDIFIDRDGTSQIEDIMDSKFKSWQRNSSKIPNFGLTLNPIWIKLSIKNASDRSINKILEVQHSLIDTIDLYYQTSENFVHIESGRKRMPNASASSLGFIFDLELEESESRTIFFRIQSSDGLQTPMILWESRAFLEADHRILSAQSLYFGILLMMLIYNLYLANRMRSRSYLYYVLFAAACGVSFYFIQGFHYRLLWKTHNSTTAFFSLLSYLTICVGALLVSSEFLQIRQKLPNLMPWLSLVWISLGLGFLGILFLPYFYALQLLQPSFIATSVIITYAAVKLTLSKDRLAKPFLIAWSLPIIGFTVTNLTLLGFMQPIIHPVFPVQIGSAAELMLLSLVLAERLNDIQRNKIKTSHKLEAAIKVHNEAKRVQESLLQPVPVSTWVETSFHYEPAAYTSGDWFGGFYDKANDRVFYFMGDVNGHGLASGIVTAAIAGSIYSLSGSKSIASSNSEKAIDLFARETNQVVRHFTKKSGHMMSMVFLVLDYKNKVCHYLNAGHPAIFVIAKQKVQAVIQPGSLLGASESPQFGKSQISWEKDQIIFLYTDGLTENQGADQKVLKARDLAKLLKRCETADGTISLLNNTTQSLWKGTAREDDVAMVALQLKAG